MRWLTAYRESVNRERQNLSVSEGEGNAHFIAGAKAAALSNTRRLSTAALVSTGLSRLSDE
jgi:hypothetical protein